MSNEDFINLVRKMRIYQKDTTHRAAADMQHQLEAQVDAFLSSIYEPSLF